MNRLLATICVCLFSLALARPVLGDEGVIEIRSAESELIDGVHVAMARLQYQLSERIEQALAGGIALEFVMEFEINRVRRWWLDGSVDTVRVAYELRFDSVSERYTLRNTNTAQRTTYATIFGALNALGRVDQLPIIDDTLLSEDGRYRVSMRASVTISEYPVSLRYLLFWRNDWRASSNRVTWFLDR
ncbi:MAG: DUF4390 domain-containing protein [Pseudomonadota bacterium]